MGEPLICKDGIKDDMQIFCATSASGWHKVLSESRKNMLPLSRLQETGPLTPTPLPLL